MNGEHAVPPVIERFLKALVVANKAVALYPPSSAIPRNTAAQVIKVLHDALSQGSELRLVVGKDGLFYDGSPLMRGNAAYASFARELYNRHLADVRFHSGTTAADVIAFLSILKNTPDEILAGGGIERRLWDLNVTAITVAETSIAIVNADQILESNGAPVDLTPEEIEQMLADYAAGRPRDRMVMARFLADPGAVSRYLHHVMDQEDGEFGLARAFDRFAEFAQIVKASISEDMQDALLCSLGDALKEIDPVSRQPILTDHILPQARTNESLADILRRMDLGELCELLMEHMDPESPAREGLGRALRNISAIIGTDKETIAQAAEPVMRKAGFRDADIADVLETAHPSKLNMTPAAQQTHRRPVDAILHMLDAAAVREKVSPDDEDLIALREEARRGITDGDVIMAYVALIGLDQREQQFNATMALLEDSLDLLVERGELELAADAADALRMATANPLLAEEQRHRVERTFGRLTKPDDIRTVAHALRLYKPGTEENLAARRLLAALGSAAIDPLLEQLAEEPDMSVRKSLVDLLSDMAPTYLSEVGAYVSDHRWYVVRNVVGILGSTHSSAMLPYLERTLRHSDVRVRRETIRALAGLTDRVAYEMLVHALTDDDAQNVQLAARYLGASKAERPIPALEQVARGEGRGNREIGPRVEAIEALGRLGATVSLPTLEALAGRRSLIGAAKTRELKVAAEAAIVRINSSRGGAT